MCDVFNILHLDFLQNEEYRLEIKFLNLDELKNLDIKNIIFKVKFKIENVNKKNY